MGLLGIIVIPLSVISLIAYYGLWKLEYWGGVLFMIIEGFSLIIDLARVEIIGVIASAVFIWYLYTKRDLYEANR